MNYFKALENEIRIKPILEKFFNIELTHNERYSIFDFCNENNYIELKCRNCYSTKYSDLMMNLNKWQEGFKFMNFNKNVYYVFEFIDGLYYYKQDFNDNFDIREYKNIKYIYIPKDKLLKINNN
jgi:hypothetical protein